MSHLATGGTDAPKFLVHREAVCSGWWDSLKALCVPAKLPTSNKSAYLFRSSLEDGFALVGRSFSASLLLHCSLVLFLFHLPQAFSSRKEVEATIRAPQRIYYEVRVLDPSRTLPRITLAETSGHSDQDSQMHRLPSPKGVIVAGNLAVISRPLHPDNSRQTILQPNTPPDIRITAEIKLPNVVMNRPVETPKMPLAFNPIDTKPLQQHQQTVAEAAPSIASPTDAEAPKLALDASNPSPRLPIPSFTVAKPVQGPRRAEAADPSSVPSPETESSPTLPDVSNSESRLPIPSFAVAKPIQKLQETKSADPSSIPSTETGSGLIVMSADPSTPVPQISLPPGSRLGEFTISPPEEKVELPGRTNGIATGDKTTSSSKAEGGSPSGSNGKDEKLAATGILSIASEGGKAEASGALGPALPPNMVFPVAAASNLRKNAMVVSSGPAGGGGLGVYGALHCGKIYTIFLPMPGKNWTMQYCVKAEAPETTGWNGRSVIIHLDEGLVPPDPESRFDYRRLPVPADKLHKMIVLKGTLREDGTVGELEIYQGVLSQMDEAARIAFSRWKFKPALQEGKPVAVEILVGIPTEAVVHHATH